MHTVLGGEVPEGNVYEVRRERVFLVLAGLSGGERIVFEPPPSLEDGDRVRPQEE